MKRLLYIIMALLILALSSCDVINKDDRYIKVGSTGSSERVVLLMDFTGWGCVNCPEAAKTANSLLDLYPENLVVVAMHPKGISFTNPGAVGPDFATDEAMEYLKAFGGSSATGLPVGVVDMTQYQSDYFVKYAKWPSAVVERMQVKAQYSISMDVTKDNYDISFSCVSGDPCSNVRMLVWLTEDSIVAAQTYSDHIDYNYMHRHVFRKCLTDQLWGEQFVDKQQGNVSSEIELPELTGEHFAVVAVLINGDTYEVLQCAEAVISGASKPKNPGDFTLSFDEEGDSVIHNLDTIRINHFDSEMGELGFEGYIHIDNQSDVDMTIVEKRDFDYSKYEVTMCVAGNCRNDDPENPGHWGPDWDDFVWEAGSSNLFKSHIRIPGVYDDEGNFLYWDKTPMTFTTEYTFSNGNTVNDKKVIVIFTYTPEPTSHR